MISIALKHFTLAFEWKLNFNQLIVSDSITFSIRQSTELDFPKNRGSKRKGFGTYMWM